MRSVKDIHHVLSAPRVNFYKILLTCMLSHHSSLPVSTSPRSHDDSITEGGSTACTGPGQAVEANPPAASPKMSAPSISPTYLPPMYV